MQVLITITGNRIGTTATLTLAIVAVYYWGYVFRYRDKLRRIRFAQLVAHAVTYVVVNGSFQLHAAVLAMINNDGGKAALGLSPFLLNFTCTENRELSVDKSSK